MIYSIGQTRFTANVARRTVYYCSQANRKCDGIKADDGHYVNGYAIGNGSWFDDEEGNIKTPNINHTYVDDKGETMPSSCSDDKEKKNTGANTVESMVHPLITMLISVRRTLTNSFISMVMSC